MKDVKKAKFECDDHDPDKSYDHLTKTFRDLVEKHAPVKTKVLKAGFHLSEIFSEFVGDWVSEFAKHVSTRRNWQRIPEWNRDLNG